MSVGWSDWSSYCNVEMWCLVCCLFTVSHFHTNVRILRHLDSRLADTTSWSRWKWDIRDRVHKDSLMGQYPEPAHTLLPCFSKIYFYIIPAAEFRFREVYPSFRFSIEIFVRGYDLCHIGRRLSCGIWWRAVWSKFSSFWGNPLPPSSG